MSYSETISYIYNLQKHGIKFGLSNITSLASILGNPHKSFPSVHVAGTNGKGSTSAFIATILKASGLKAGLFTSPHLIDFTERIKINDEQITEYEVISLTEEIRSKVAGFSPTFFEVVTAMAFLYFQRKEIDIAVIEVGMGGRLDATNIVVPEVSVITGIDYDHREFLGETIKEIANEKAGIIKDDMPVIVSMQPPEVLKVIEAKARERNSKVYLYGRDFSALLKRGDPSGICFDYFDDAFAMHDLYLPLAGEHQMQNASVAIKAATLLLNKIGEKQRNGENEKRRKRQTGISPAHEEEIMLLMSKGLASVKWPGRLEMIKNDPPILIDGAHNPAAAVVLSHALVKNFLSIYKKIILVLGIMGDKDIEGIMQPLLPIASEIILTSPSYKRAAPPAKLASIAASLGFPEVRIAPTLQDAIEMAKNLSLVTHHSSLIVITGSFYTIGEAKEALGQKGILTRLRE